MSVIANYLLNGSVPAVVGGTGITIKYFSDLPANPSGWLSSNPNVNTPATSNQQGVTPTTTSNLGGLPVPGRSVLNGQRFKIVASGDILFDTGDASGGAGTVKLQISTAASTASPAYSTIFSLTANQPLDGVTYPWTIVAEMQGTTASGVLQGTANGQFDGTLQVTNGATGFTAVTGVSFAVEPAFVVVVGVTFPTSSANNTANLYELKVIQD